jgi:hypothetical protein
MGMLKPLIAAVAVTALALPASAADAAHPVHGTFLNKSRKNGVRLATTPHFITTTSFYCAKSRWDLVTRVRVRRDGSFVFHGRMRQYGPSGQPWGEHRAHFSGRFTSRRHVRIRRTLAGRCGTRTVHAKGKRF